MIKSWTTTLTKLLRCTGSTPIIGKRPKSEQDKLLINELRVQISIKLFFSFLKAFERIYYLDLLNNFQLTDISGVFVIILKMCGFKSIKLPWTRCCFEIEKIFSQKIRPHVLSTVKGDGLLLRYFHLKSRIEQSNSSATTLTITYNKRD